MKQDEFRTALERALRAAGVMTYPDRFDDLVDLQTMSRKGGGYLGMGLQQPAEPFMGTLELSWEWDALMTARMETTEEDELTTFVGRAETPNTETEPPAVRVDVRLHGKLALDKPLLVPPGERWRAWVAEVASKINPLLPEGADISSGAISSRLGDPEARVRVRPGRRALAHRRET
jgi:hypothetical protein